MVHPQSRSDPAGCDAAGAILTPTRRHLAPRIRGERVVAAGALVAVYGAAVAVANRFALPRPGAGTETTEQVTVVVPARDEATRIGAVVGDLRAQRGVPRLRVVIVDDDSSDGTADVARDAAAGDPRFTVLRLTEPPPAGWTGKAAACARGIAHLGSGDPASSADPGVVVFVDADVRLEPDALAATVTLLRRRDAALVSPWPYQVAESPVERLVQPLLFWSWFALLPVAVAHRVQRPSMAVACGQFLAFDAATYAAIGGHAAVASSPTEDLDLARTVRRAGRRTLVAAAGSLVSCRMYEGARPLIGGYTRWLWSAFGSPGGAAAVIAVSAVAYVLPPVAAVTGRGRVRHWGVVGAAAGVASRLLARTTERGSGGRSIGYGLDALDTVAHPASILALGGLTAASIRARRAGRASWKTRVLP